jgi:hypothetical protein
MIMINICQLLALFIYSPATNHEIGLSIVFKMKKLGSKSLHINFRQTPQK